jgi:hypothetical protein
MHAVTQKGSPRAVLCKHVSHAARRTAKRQTIVILSWSHLFKFMNSVTVT